MPAKKLKPPCMCRMKCYERLPENERQQIFNSYWNEENITDVKRQFIFSCIESVPTVRVRKMDPNSNKSKNNTLHYHFTVNNQRFGVCKVMFLNTLCISNLVVLNVLKKIEPGGLIQADQRGKHTPINKTSDEIKNSVHQHINSFPKYESHYSKEKSEKHFLGTELTIEKIYQLYMDKCNESNVDPKLRAKKWLYSDIFNKEFKLSFKPPEIDTCDTCSMLTAKLKNDLTEDEKNLVQADYDAHLIESKTRYDLKQLDFTMAKNSPKQKVLAGDLQKCLH
ncbi:hypothetical protein J6590_108570 [Homalodisca vitripennis]|nr:hypothetical protein J6590_108570 [Homalodisca vitripennis]